MWDPSKLKASAATCANTQQPDDAHKSNSYCINNKQQDNVINVLSWHNKWQPDHVCYLV